jgi:hypothetical protein
MEKEELQGCYVDDDYKKLKLFVRLTLRIVLRTK